MLVGENSVCQEKSAPPERFPWDRERAVLFFVWLDYKRSPLLVVIVESPRTPARVAQSVSRRIAALPWPNWRNERGHHPPHACVAQRLRQLIRRLAGGSSRQGLLLLGESRGALWSKMVSEETCP
jgi:hypothetical protein